MPPRRRGLFRRIIDRIFGGAPEQPRPPEPSPPIQPPAETLREAAQRHERVMQSEYREIRRLAHDPENLTDYDSWREVFDPFTHMFDSYEETEEYWDEFLRAFYLTTAEPGHVLRTDFYSDTGIPRSEIDWDLWRQIKRGTP